MIRSGVPYLDKYSRMVFVSPIFELAANSTIPHDKSDLVKMYSEGKAVVFHRRICRQCHSVPMLKEWVKDPGTNKTMTISTVSKRVGQYDIWEPIFIGTNSDPLYHEDLTWEGKREKMVQAYQVRTTDTVDNRRNKVAKLSLHFSDVSHEL